jgi:preprotein translocase subunit SecG
MDVGARGRLARDAGSVTMRCHGRPLQQTEARQILAVLSPYRVYFQVAQIIIAVALIISILLQARGAGLGSVFGGTGTVFKTRRGIERMLFNMTVFFAVFFAILSFLCASIPAPA